MPATSRQQLGQRGEQLAAAYLQKKGHTLVARNYRSGRSELDIVSTIGQTLVVTEVKSFVTPPLDAAEFRVHLRKQRALFRGAYGFLREHAQYKQFDLRFDVIIVNFSVYPANITHYEAAFWDEQGWDGNGFWRERF